MDGTTTLRWLRARLLPYVVSTAVLTAVLVPMGWERGRDSFPLSSYPMFSQPRERESRVATVIGVGERGERVILDPWLIGGSDEVILASATAWRAVAGAPEAADRLCGEVAARVAARVAASPRRLTVRPTALEVVVEWFDTVAFFQGEDEPLDRRVFARCPVPEGTP